MRAAWVLYLVGCRVSSAHSMGEHHPDCAGYADADGDGHGSLDGSPACSTDPGVTVADDCDDGDPHAWPGAPEVCGDGVRQDCSRDATGCEWSGQVHLVDANRVYIGPAVDGMTGLEHTFVPLGESDQLAVSAYLAPAAGVEHAGEVFLLSVGEKHAVVDLAGIKPLVAGDGEAILGGMLFDGTEVGPDAGPAVFATTWWRPILFGSDGAEVARTDLGTSLGGMLSRMDFTGDATPDLVMSNAVLMGSDGDYTQGTYVFDGLVSGEFEPTDAWGAYLNTHVEGETAYKGETLSNGRDIDGDGRPDLLLGDRYAQGADQAGAVWVVNDPPSGNAPIEEVFTGEILGGGPMSTSASISTTQVT